MNSLALIAPTPLESDILRREITPSANQSVKTLQEGKLHGKNVIFTHCGIGKVNAAHSATIVLENYEVEALVIFGIGGGFCASIGDVAVAKTENYGEEGVLTGDGWKSMEITGFPLVTSEKFSPANNVKLPSANNVKLPSANNVKLPSANNVKLPSANNVKLPSANNVKLPSANNVKLPSANNVKLPSANNVKLPSANNIKLPSANNVKLPSANNVKLPSASYSKKLMDTKKYYNTFQMDENFFRQAIEAARAVGLNVISGNFVTVSQCSGTNSSAQMMNERFNSVCENMEGAAVAHICALYDVPVIEIRGISNIVGDRNMSNWRIDEAAANCNRAVLEFVRRI